MAGHSSANHWRDLLSGSAFANVFQPRSEYLLQGALSRYALFLQNENIRSSRVLPNRGNGWLTRRQQIEAILACAAAVVEGSVP